MKKLDASTTHLLCGRAGTRFHRATCKRNAAGKPPIAIVRLSWLAACSRVGAAVDTAEHALPPLAAFEVCCSAVEPEEKVRVEEICGRNGAVYKRSLRPSCTHLLCSEPLGDKFEHAKKEQGKSPFLVDKEWIFECDRQGTLLDEADFPVMGCVDARGKFEATGEVPEKAEGPEKDEVPEKDDDEDKDEEDAVKPVKKKKKKSAQWPPKVDVEMTQEPIEQGEEEKALSPVTMVKKRQRPSAVEPVPPSTSQVAPSCQSPNSRSSTPTSLLDACTFYIAPPHRKPKITNRRIRSLIALAGGTISAALSSRVNHIILTPPLHPSHLSEIAKAQKLGAKVVSHSWVESTVRDSTIPPVVEVPRDQWIIDQTPRPQSQLVGPVPRTEVVSTLFQGMRCALGPLALFDSTLVHNIAVKLQRGRAKVLQHDETGVVTSGVATHVICGESLPAGSKKLIEHAQEQNKYATVVSTAWVDTCLDENTLMPTSDCVLYEPVLFETPLTGFVSGTVNITISGHQIKDDLVMNRRREVLSRLARVLGANYSERMTRSKTTHLIVDGRTMQRSNKRERARDWGIAVVSYEWLLACAKQGCLVNAADYPFKEVPVEDDEGMVDVGENGEDEIRAGRIREGGKEVTSPRLTASGRKRRSSRLQTTYDDAEPKQEPKAEENEEAGETSEATIALFQQFANNFEPTQAGVAADENAVTGPRVRRRARSRPRTGDGPEIDIEREWSLDASQSQVIQHRDLTPPPTPKRTSIPRAAKRGRK